MHVLYCGESDTKDVSIWSPGVDVGKPREFSDSCYLIRHDKGWMLWESGISDAIADKPDGVVVGGGILTLRMKTTLASQLRELGVTPADIKYLGFSHFHGDHVGNANAFTEGTLYIQQAEYDAAFGPEPGKFNFNPALYEKLRATPIVRLQGDHDVFGDNSVTILSTPGHTPGHQSLLVRLPKTGVVLLSGDATHFEENWVNRRVPARNFDREQSLASMEKIARVLEREGAKLWINHDKLQTGSLPHAPDFAD
jgi:glyoxylase-like metal-dependent hydrolase (beta-lactamase superfamily II)